VRESAAQRRVDVKTDAYSVHKAVLRRDAPIKCKQGTEMNIDELALKVFDPLLKNYMVDHEYFLKVLNALIAEYEKAAGSEPFWYAVVSDEAPVVNKAIRSLEVAEEYAAKSSDVYPGVHVVPLYARPDQRVAELEQENARLKEITIPVNIDYGDGAEEVAYGNKHQAARLKKWLDKYFSQKGQLALAQADNQRLREFAQKISEQIPEKPDYWSSCGQCSNNADEAEDLIAQSQDVSALEAIVQKAGEVMRERCNRSSVDRIQYLPGVTLGDLR